MNRAERRRAAKTHEHNFTVSPSTIKADGKPDYASIECDKCAIRFDEVPPAQRALTFVEDYSPGMEQLAPKCAELGRHEADLEGSITKPETPTDEEVLSLIEDGLECRHCHIPWKTLFPDWGD